MTLYQHFNPEERLFIDKILDYKYGVEESYQPKLLNFLTPREQYVASQLFRKEDVVSIYFYSDEMERQPAIISRSQPTTLEYNVALLTICYPIKFYTLKHSQILGAVLGAGLKRDCVGDIVTDGKQWQIVVSKKVAQFLMDNVEKIGAVPVTLKESDKLLLPVNAYQTLNILVSSLRVDVIVAEVFNVSRKKSKDLVLAQNVQVNWLIDDNPDTVVRLTDILSVRKYGRIEIEEIIGLSKKGKYKLKCKVINNR